MKRSVVWPIAALLALGVVVLGLATVEAQRGGMERPAPAPHTGRFVVAHALAERIVILDTATGQLYVAGEKDMKKFAELPKYGDGRPMLMEREFDEEKMRRFKDRFRKKDEGEKKEEKKEKDPS